ncbi:hypothetical protein COT48_00970 [Candidatus Woesearchaeota archaeon CG08_land_8_20_14_0_20_47_9]|nr:MAG: hypothetical protein COT48_00970 [Candidatus Woesearchaeota archaeon CG08_land_8_20_14_0_20_47_9]HII30176.1 hypothetical protein [Candidatus Woesearchaeota archaeon]
MKDMDAQELAAISDLVLGAFSTVLVEAIYMRKPVISMQPGLRGEDPIAFLTERKIIPVGYSEEACRLFIKTAILTKAYRKELLQKVSGFRTDGKATKRVVNLIYEMLGVSN